MKVLAVVFVAILQCWISTACDISKDQFHSIVAAAGHSNVPAHVYDTCFASQTKKYSCEELAMIITQLIHESGGFQFTEEWACTKAPGANGCQGQYVDNVGIPGKQYYGRGYIQLTWGANYKAAGEALGVDLLHNPEQVAQPEMACKTSLWYWDTRVHPSVGDAMNFGVTTKAINGALECNGGPNEKAQHRYDIYKKVAAAMNIQRVASPNGCS